VLLSAWRLATGATSEAVVSYGSFNLDGPAADLLARLSTPIAVALVGIVTFRCARAPAPDSEVARRDRLAIALLASLAALWLSAKVFSPQYLTWALPLVLAVSSRRGELLRWLLFATMTVTQVYLRGYYGQVIHGTAIGVATLLVRLLFLVAFAVVAFRGLDGTAPGASRARRRLSPGAMGLS
jgi:hypothetical protein